MRKIFNSMLAIFCLGALSLSLFGCGGERIAAYEIAVQNGFQGTGAEWLLSLQLGKPGADGLDGVGIESVEIDQNGDLIITLTNGETCNAGSIRDLINE